MMRIDIAAPKYFKFSREAVRREVKRVVTVEGWDVAETEVVISVVGERAMIDLHKKYMKTAETTDVLSFPQAESACGEKPEAGPDGICRLGDIVICYPVAVRQARETGKTVDEEMAFLAGHGTLHLLGRHHD